MTEKPTTKQTVIVIGAGANADFRLQNARNDQSISMPTGEQLVRKIADEDELIKSVSFLFFEKFIRTKFDKSFHDSKLEECTNLMCDFFNSIERSFLSQQEISQEYFYKEWERNYAGNQPMLGIRHFALALMDQIPIPERKKGAKAIKEAIAGFIKNDFSHYFELSEIVRSTQPFSIDELLNSIENEKVFTTKRDSGTSKKELVEAGKVLIANYLLQAEDEKTFQDFESICWYRHLRNMIMNCGGNYKEVSSKIDQLTIISFNYDRSLEHFLRIKLSPFYDKLKERIIYPYGNLLKTDEEKNSFLEIPYGFLKEESSLSYYQRKSKIFEVAEKIHRSLRIIGEIEGAEKKEIRSIISNAHKLYFLGFSFNQENCDVLGLFNKELNNKFQASDNTIYYTNYKSSKKIEKRFNGLFPLLKSAGLTAVSDKGAYEALAEDFDLQLL